MPENPTKHAEEEHDWRQRLTDLLAGYGRREQPEGSRARQAAAIAWQSELVDAGLAAPGWPKSAGGMELGVADQLDYYRMITAAGAPRHPCRMSFIVAPTLIVHGTETQKARYLDPLLRADEFWCQGFSEPGAGSDLASLSTRAVRDGDRYRVSGQKIWTTMADRADWMFALVRTGPQQRGTDGISYLLIDMRSPGIEVRPLRDAAGGRHFAEVFLDDVEVPVTNLVGREGQGWSIMRTSLGHERATAFLADEFRYRKVVDKVVRLAARQGYGADPLIRSALAELETDVRAIATNSARALDAVLRKEEPGGVASLNRLVKSEFEQRLHRLALRLTGPAAMLGNRSPGALDGGRWSFGYLMSRATTIGAGTAEIQRNALAEVVLGLPSHRGEGQRSPAVPPGRPLAPPDDDESAVRRAVGAAVRAQTDVEAILAGDHDATETWRALVDFGLPGLSVPEEHGGGGASIRLLCAAVEEAAYHLSTAPLVPTLAALSILQAVGDHEGSARIVGGAPAAPVLGVTDAGWVIDAAVVCAGGRLRGTQARVAGAPAAEVLVVGAVDADGQPVLAVVESSAAGIEPQESVDLTASVGTVALDDASARVIAVGEEARSAVAQAAALAGLVLAADSVGVANRALALAADWARTREQFGRPIGSFQAVSHRCADMLVDAEGARNQVLAAADLVTGQQRAGVPGHREGPATDVAEVDLVVTLATARALSAAVRVCEAGIQIHGGIGFTWEHPGHLLLRRALANEAWLARPEALRDRAAGLLLAQH
ncbi:MAG: acyl-CoA dehydrogenase family protein [Gordonia sp. (in: high G+C Gram-positive bacteria)]